MGLEISNLQAFPTKPKNGIEFVLTLARIVFEVMRSGIMPLILSVCFVTSLPERFPFLILPICQRPAAVLVSLLGPKVTCNKGYYSLVDANVFGMQSVYLENLGNHRWV